MTHDKQGCYVYYLYCKQLLILGIMLATMLATDTRYYTTDTRYHTTCIVNKMRYLGKVFEAYISKLAHLVL